MTRFISRNYFAAFLLVSAISYSSCKKDTTPPPVEEPSPYYINCTIDGVESKSDTVFDAYLRVSIRPGFPSSTLILNGYDKELNTNFSFSIDNHTSGYTYGYPLPLGVGSYNTQKTEYGMSIIFTRVGTSFVNDTAGNFNITITSLDSVSVKGTFNGKLYKEPEVAGPSDLPNGPEYKEITNGEFYLKMKK
jgi:hypothetical protein